MLSPKAIAIAGDLCVVAKLTKAETTDTLSNPDAPVLVEPWMFPDALLPVAITAASKSDEDKLAGALARLVAEDPTMRLEHNNETHQVILWTMGQAHVDVLLSRLRDRYGVQVESEPLRMALRETFVSAAKGHGRHVKQSGGHGQYAICDITVEPLERGAGFEFVDKVVGGAVPRQYIPSVAKGIRAQLEKGCLAGYPMVDLRVTLMDGKSHSVDSSDMAFQAAGALALKDAASPQTVTLLEPVDSVSVVVSDEYVGAVMTDLQMRRGRVMGTEPDTSGRTTISAEVPTTEVTRYAIDLRSVSHGTGTFSRTPLGYEPMPPHLLKDQLPD
jgi:elongation factor G